MDLNRVATTLTRWRFLSLSLALSTTLIGCADDIVTESDFTPPDLRTPSSDWELVWSDEFDTNSLDMTKWSFETNCSGGGNNEEQCYTDSPENLFIQNGILNIVAKPTPAGSGLTLPYTSSRIVTKDKAKFKYGRIEIRAKSPKGQGTFAAGWMLPNDDVYGGWPYSGEIDIVEWVNIGEVRADGDVDSHVHGTLHYGPLSNNHDYSGNEYALPTQQGPETQFHTYAIEWEEGEIRWYVDDVLFGYQRDSDVTYRPVDGEANGLSTKGWYTVDNNSTDKEILYTSAPFDQDFFIILNNAVGGDWAGNVNQSFEYVVGDDKGTLAKGVDHSAYVNGNALLVDYVRVYQCVKDPATGKGCATINSDYYNGTYVRGAAPVPIPPILPVPVGVTIFDNSDSVWSLVGEQSSVVEATESEYGEVALFTTSNTSEAIGFSGIAYDSELLPDDAKVEFDLYAVNLTSDANISVVMESTTVDTETQESTVQTATVLLSNNLDALNVVAGEWQHFMFDLGQFREQGLDSTAITSIKLVGVDGELQIDNVAIGAAFEGAKLTLFEDAANQNWPLWDSRVADGESDAVPVVVADDAEHGNVAEFTITGSAVVGFNVRTDQGGSGYPFDGSSLSQSGVIEFDLKLMNEASNPNAPWYLKIESNGGTALGGTADEIRLLDPPILNEWVHYKLPLKPLVEDGFDVSAIDVVLVFPTWGQGNGAVFRLDNFKIHSSGPVEGGTDVPKGPDNTLYDRVYTVFQDGLHSSWRLWDCCAFLTQQEVEDDAEHGTVAEFTIGEGVDGGSVVGFFGRDTGGVVDVNDYINDAVLRFDMKVEAMPTAGETTWLMKLESAGANTSAEVELTTSKQGEAPRLGEWQSYSFPVIDLASAGLDLTAIDIIMVFPSWGNGTDAVYRIDNVFFGIPSEDDIVDDLSEPSNNQGEVKDPNGALVANGSFDSASHWGGTDGMAASISNGIFSANIAAAGNPWDVSLKQSLPLTADTTYTLTFDARSNDSREISAGLGLDFSPWTSEVETVSLTPTWTTYNVTITTTGFGSDSSRVFFDMGAAVGEVQLDNVSVVIDGEASVPDDSTPTPDAQQGEQIVNGSFNTANNWGGTDGMAASITNGIFSADIAAAGSPWDVSLKQVMTLVPDTTYVLTFDARSDDSRDIIAGLGLDYDPWTNVVETRTLTPNWATYSITITTTGFGDATCRVFFDMGAAVGEVQLDNVSVMVQN